MTFFWSITALVFPGCGAYAIARAGSRCLPDRPATIVLRLCLAVGMGFGGSACTYFLWRVLFDGPRNMYVALDSILWLVIALTLTFGKLAHMPVFWRRESHSIWEPKWSDLLSLREPAHFMGRTAHPGPFPLDRVALDRPVTWLFSVVLAVAAFGIIGETLARPYGGWDAWGIWNLRARFLFRLGYDWRKGFTAAFAHVDYPLLVPATVARWWTYLGSDPLWVSAAVGIAFTAITVAAVVSGVSLQRGRNQGLLAGMVLLGTVRFLRWGAAQYSDVPLAFFFLTALLLLVLHDEQRRHAAAQPDEPRRSPAGLIFLAGLAAGLAAWTKNEGLLFCVVLLTARAATVFIQHGWRRSLTECLGLAAGAAPILAVVVLHKLQIPQRNDMVNSLGTAETMHKILDPVRFQTILGAFASGGLQLLTAFAVVIPLCFLLLGRYRDDSGRRDGPSLSVSVLGLMLAGYFGVYLTTPHDLGWHLSTSLDRLLVQIWPMAVWAVFMHLQSLDAVWRPRIINGPPAS